MNRQLIAAHVNFQVFIENSGKPYPADYEKICNEFFRDLHGARDGSLIAYFWTYAEKAYREADRAAA